MYIGEWKDWIQNISVDKLFRMYEYKHFAPDDSRFPEDELSETFAKFIFIEEAITLPNGDILLGVSEPGFYELEDYRGDNSKGLPIFYHKLSDIRLEYFPNDFDTIFWDENPQAWEYMKKHKIKCGALSSDEEDNSDNEKELIVEDDGIDDSITIKSHIHIRDFPL